MSGVAWLVCGTAGSGKTTLGTQLAEAEGAALLDLDVVAGPLRAVVAALVCDDPEDVGHPAVRAALGDAPYAALLGTARQNLDVGRDVVVVAPFTALRSSAAAAHALVTRLRPADVRVVWVTCPPSELLRRLVARGAPRDRRKLADPEAVVAHAAAPPALPHAAVDATLPLDQQVPVARTAPLVPVELPG